MDPGQLLIDYGGDAVDNFDVDRYLDDDPTLH